MAKKTTKKSPILVKHINELFGITGKKFAAGGPIEPGVPPVREDYSTLMEYIAAKNMYGTYQEINPTITDKYTNRNADEQINNQFRGQNIIMDSFEQKPVNIMDGKEMMVSTPARAKAEASFNRPASTDQSAKNKTNWGDNILTGLAITDYLIPQKGLKRQEVVRPTTTFNNKMYGRGSQAIMKDGGKMKANLGMTVEDPKPKKKPMLMSSNYKDINWPTRSESIEATRARDAMVVDPLTQKRLDYDFQQEMKKQQFLQQNPNLDINSYITEQQQLQGSFNKDGDWIPNSIYNKPGRFKNVKKTSIDENVNQYTKMQYGGSIKKIGDNEVDGGTFMFNGPSHEEGGIDINFGGVKAEVEGDETAAIDSQGSLNIFGNMIVPGTKKKFKTVAKNLGEMESNISKNMDKGMKLINESDPQDMFERLASNSGKMKVEGAEKKKQQIAQSKELLSALQNEMLMMAQVNGLEPKAMSEGKQIKAKFGAKMSFAAGGEIDPDLLVNIKQAIWKAEGKSGYDILTKMGGTAYGKYQFIKDTRQKYYNTNKKEFEDQFGIKNKEEFEDAFKNNRGNIQELVMNKHIESLHSKYGGDVNLILAAHRLGEGAANSLQKTGKATITTAKGEKRTIGWDDPIMASVSGEKETLREYVKRAGISTSSSTTQVDPPKSAAPVAEAPTPITTGLTKALGVDQSKRTFSRNPPDFGKGAKSTPYNPSIHNMDKDMSSATDQNKLKITQIAPELAAIGTNRVRPVPVQKYEPEMYSPYQVSYQDMRNENTASFNAIQSTLASNPAALGTLAAQKYMADTKIGAEEFRVNQGIESDIINKNVSLRNDAQFRNLGLADQQMVRQEQARSNTKRDLFTALSSISSKVLQNELENIKTITNEALYDFRYQRNNKGQIVGVGYEGADPAFRWGTPTNTTNQVSDATTVRTMQDAQGNIKNITTLTDSKNQQTLDKQRIQRNNWDWHGFFPRQSRGRR